MPKYKVGDVVRVKDFEDIVAESACGVDGEGDVYTRDDVYFVSNMRRYCGNQYVVRNAYSKYGEKANGALDRYNLEGVSLWTFSNSMLCDASCTPNIEISHSFDELFFDSQ